MKIIRDLSLLTLLGYFLLNISGCASTAPLPATLNIVPPSPDLSPEIAAFSGIWEGQWRGFQDTILVVEKIDNNKAEVILSYGMTEGFEARYFYKTAEVSDGPVIRWTDPSGDQMIFKIDKDLDKIHGAFTEKKTGAIGRLLLYKRNPK